MENLPPRSHLPWCQLLPSAITCEYREKDRRHQFPLSWIHHLRHPQPKGVEPQGRYKTIRKGEGSGSLEVTGVPFWMPWKSGFRRGRGSRRWEERRRSPGIYACALSKNPYERRGRPFLVRGHGTQIAIFCHFPRVTSGSLASNDAVSEPLAGSFSEVVWKLVPDVCWTCHQGGYCASDHLTDPQIFAIGWRSDKTHYSSFNRVLSCRLMWELGSLF